jgi:hypothetical protein
VSSGIFDIAEDSLAGALGLFEGKEFWAMTEALDLPDTGDRYLRHINIGLNGVPGGIPFPAKISKRLDTEVKGLRNRDKAIEITTRGRAVSTRKASDTKSKIPFLDGQFIFVPTAWTEQESGIRFINGVLHLSLSAEGNHPNAWWNLSTKNRSTTKKRFTCFGFLMILPNAETSWLKLDGGRSHKTTFDHGVVTAETLTPCIILPRCEREWQMVLSMENSSGMKVNRPVPFVMLRLCVFQNTTMNKTGTTA